VISTGLDINLDLAFSGVVRHVSFYDQDVAEIVLGETKVLNVHVVKDEVVGTLV
jgi:hypothetical protein